MEEINGPIAVKSFDLILWRKFIAYCKDTKQPVKMVLWEAINAFLKSKDSKHGI